jgi:hypothetical protein
MTENADAMRKSPRNIRIFNGPAMTLDGRLKEQHICMQQMIRHKRIQTPRLLKRLESDQSQPSDDVIQFRNPNDPFFGWVDDVFLEIRLNQIISDANNALSCAQKTIEVCEKKDEAAILAQIVWSTKQIRLRPEEYPLFSERIRRLMIAITNIEENWKRIDPTYRIATDENLRYEKLINYESKILNTLDPEASIQSDGGAELISQIKDFAETVKEVLERAISCASDCITHHGQLATDM